MARLLGHSPTSVEYTRHGRHNEKTLRARFGGSWADIVARAGLCYTRRHAYRVPSTGELKKDIVRVADKLGHPPNHGQYKELGRFDPRTIIHRAGTNDWSSAIVGLCGFDPEAVKQCYGRGAPYQPTEQRLKRLRELAQALGHAPSSKEAKMHGISTSVLYERVGGTWTCILRAAGLDERQMRRNLRTRATPTDVMLGDVLLVARRLGRCADAAGVRGNGEVQPMIKIGRFSIIRTGQPDSRGEPRRFQCGFSPEAPRSLGSFVAA